MACISDPNYALHAIRLSALRTTDDPVTPRIVTLDPAFGANPYIAAMGLADIDRWPEIPRALDSPPPERMSLPVNNNDSEDEFELSSAPKPRLRDNNQVGAAPGLRYSQTIMGTSAGGMGMRVSGRRDQRDGDDIRARLRARRAAAAGRLNLTPGNNNNNHGDASQLRDTTKAAHSNDIFSRADGPGFASAPAPAPLGLTPIEQPVPFGVSIAGEKVGPGDSELSDVAGSVSEVSVSDGDQLKPPSTMGEEEGATGSSAGVAASAFPSDLAMGSDSEPLTGGGLALDEGSDVGDDLVVDEDVLVPAPPVAVGPPVARRTSRDVGGANRTSTFHEDERRSSTDTTDEPKLEFVRVLVEPQSGSLKALSGLTAALNQHVPHLVSTGAGAPPPEGGVSAGSNPFASLYLSVAAPPTVPSVSLDLFFPTSVDPSDPIRVKVRKDATVEEVTGYGLYMYWEQGKEPSLDDGEADWSTVGWGLRICEDDGEVDEDFPPLDRESQIAKFAYGEFAVVLATESQRKQNEAMAPLIHRRPSRVIADVPQRQPSATRPKPPDTPSEMPSTPTFNTESQPGPHAGLGSATAHTLTLRVRVSASADVQFNTTINVPSDMYIADLIEVLVQRKHLSAPPTDWVLCLADLSLALPPDRTVASLEGKSDLALVHRRWARENGLRVDRAGGDPSASVFQGATEPVTAARFGPGDYAYKKYIVQRKTPIGRHERVLAIDGDYIHILPSENRTFFDTMKTTSFHITLVASVKLSGRAGGFKLYVWRDGSQKRYEFEAENGKQAQEIIGNIKQLMKMYRADRNSIVVPTVGPRTAAVKSTARKR